MEFSFANKDRLASSYNGIAAGDDSRVRMTKMLAQNVDVYYGDKQVPQNISLDIQENRVTALIGPSGCGKLTFLRCLNRMNDTIEGCRVPGSILMDGEDINGPQMDPVALRARVGMVF